MRIATAASLVLLSVVGWADSAAGHGVGSAGAPAGERSSRPSGATTLANRCFLVRGPGEAGYLATASDGYAAGARRSEATRFFFKPTALDAGLLRDDRGQLMVAREGGSVGRASSPRRAAEWTPRPGAGARLRLREAFGSGELALARSGRRLTLASRPSPRGRFLVRRARGCDRYPEAPLGARGASFKGERGGPLAGIADLHMHITADHRAGGEVIHGQSFDRYGLPVALGGDEETHGADGSLDVTGNLLRSGLPFGGHDTQGWPAFSGWPVHDTVTHQQLYYRWLQRSWKAGLRLAVAQVIEDEPLCRLQPIRSNPCRETPAAKLQIRVLRALERYVDAQAGGRGRGFLRLVESPGQARRVIRRGKLAVVIGIEWSSPFGCSELEGKPECDRADVDRGVEQLQRLGVSSVFLAHWIDNAFAGAALQGGAQGAFINLFNRLQTGRYFRTAACPDPRQGVEMRTLSPLELQVLSDFYPSAVSLLEDPMPDYPEGRRCNAKGLTPLGRYAVRRLIEQGILIETDHLSERARASVLEIADRRGHPLVSSHTGTGGEWTPAQLRTLYRAGGIASATPTATPRLAEKITELGGERDPGRWFGAPLGTDTGGFNSLPGPPEPGEAQLDYPFRSHDGEVIFRRQRTGTRTFDFNSDGVAHYGLFPDLLAAMEQEQHGGHAADSVFRSAEAYLRTWRRARRG